MLRGTPAGLEFVFDARPFSEASSDLWGRLAERPDFYRGSTATIVFTADVPGAAEFAGFLERARGYGIGVRAVRGPASAGALAGVHALPYSEAQPQVSQAGRHREQATVTLPDAARSLDADFAGARADLARRRRRGPVAVTSITSVSSISTQRDPATLYLRENVRGGRSLQQLGSIVVVGDVNPGAELVASGDVVVFGTLRGTVHAGAQGDLQARVFAVGLMPTQLRIAQLIAADTADVESRQHPEEAFVHDGRIVVARAGTAK